MGCH